MEIKGNANLPARSLIKKVDVSCTTTNHNDPVYITSLNIKGSFFFSFKRKCKGAVYAFTAKNVAHILLKLLISPCSKIYEIYRE